jgi:hypothetical protein
MKKLVGFAVMFAVCGVMAGCGTTNEPTDTIVDLDVIVIPDNGNPDVVVNPDVPRDTNVDPDVIIGTDEGTDVCVPNCGTQECGNDPVCGTPCGTCTGGKTCEDNMCVGGVDCVGDDEGSCSAFVDCANACGNPNTPEGEACVADCQTLMSSQGQADYQVFQECLYTTCGNISDQDLWNDCLNENCGAAFIGCFWGCTYLTCSEMNGCINGCPDDNPATTDDEFVDCYWACKYDSTKEAQTDSAEIRDCAFAACEICQTAETDPEWAECDVCYQDAYYGACWETAVATSCMVFGTEHQTCREFTACFTACPTSPAADRQACMTDCTESSTANAFHDRIVAENCSTTACPDCLIEEPTTAEEESCNTCWTESVTGECATEWAPCLAEPGTDACSTVFECINTCTGNGCQQACFDAGDENAQTLFLAMQDCVSAKCDSFTDPTEWSTCANTAINEGGDCATEMAACTADV